MTLKTRINASKRISIAFIITTLIYLTSPLFILFFSFFWLLRVLLTLWKKLCHPQLGPLLGGMDSVMISESPYTTAQSLSTAYYFVVQGKIELQEFQTVVRNGLSKFSQDNDSSGRLSQVLRTWAGFFVGEEEKNFKPQDHVRLLNVEELNERIQQQCDLKTRKSTKVVVRKEIHQEHFTDDELAQLNWDLIKVPFKEDTSPWEYLVLHNPQGNSESESELQSKTVNRHELSSRVAKNKEECTTVIFARHHHSLADGIVLNCMYSHFFDQGQERSFGRTMDFFYGKGNDKKKSKLETFARNCTNFILGLPEFVFHITSCKTGDWPPTDLPSSTINNNNPFSGSHVIPVQFSKEKIQKIQKLCEGRKIKSTTVIHAVLAMSVTDYFKTYNKKGREALAHLPPYAYADNPFGEPSTRNEMTNNLIVLGVRVPFGPGLTKKDNKSILYEIQESQSHETDSRIRHVSKSLVDLAGLLPPKLRPPITVLCKALCISYVPTFESSITILGKPVLSVRACTGDFPAISCFTVFCFGIQDKIQGCFVVTKKVLESYDEVKALANSFENKFDDLYHDLIHMQGPKD